jgi:tetratricopeptide (TPR) repeat protein
VPDHPRIEELRRRVEADPASIAFAQLGEEYRRAGNVPEAIRVCRAGLVRHPGYLSARVTLGRALLEHNELDAARAELELVLQSAPENLAAVRGLAEIHHRRGDVAAALAQYRTALQLARHDPDLEQTIADLERELNAKPKTPTAALSLEEVQAEFLNAFGGAKTVDAPPPPAPASAPAVSTAATVTPDAGRDGPIEALEQLLHAIMARRAALQRRQ